MIPRVYHKGTSYWGYEIKYIDQSGQLSDFTTKEGDRCHSENRMVPGHPFLEPKS